MPAGAAPALTEGTASIELAGKAEKAPAVEPEALEPGARGEAGHRCETPRELPVSSFLAGLRKNNSVICRARRSKAPAWARFGRGRAHKNLEPGPGRWLGLGLGFRVRID